MIELEVGNFVVRIDDPNSYGQLIYIQKDVINPGYIVNHGETEITHNKEDLKIHEKGVEAYREYYRTGSRWRR